MKKIRRIYVEKKPGREPASESLLADLQTHIAPGLKSLRLLNRYDAEGLDEDDWSRCVPYVFAEPAVDNTWDQLPEADYILAVRYLPGQYDQRADSAMQCIQAITRKEAPIVETARVYLCCGTLSETERSRIRDYFINPVDSMEAPLSLPSTLGTDSSEPEAVRIMDGFTAMDSETLYDLHTTMGLAMRPEDLVFCRDYFRKEQRDPTVTELRVIDTYWSDHCRHTTFTTELDDIIIEDGLYKKLFDEAFSLYREERQHVYGDAAADREITLMDIAVMGMKALKKRGMLADLDESEEVNACSIVVPVDVDGETEEWLLLFKNETHNHPTEIEPYGGAATCLGGAIRDPLSGRAYVYQAMRVTGSGDPTAPLADTWPGKLPQRKITTQAAAGFSAYGNQIGLATGHVAEVYHEGYTAKRMEIGAVIGAVRRSHVRREEPVEGDVILLLGGQTGRDGCGGATGSSKGHTEASLTACGAEVQKGNPLTERKLQRLFNNPAVSRLIKRCNDFGAGGVCVAVGELADGMDINLDAVRKKYEGLDGTELAISESQERMAVVVERDDAQALIAYAAEENLEATPVAVVTSNGHMIMRWRGDVIVDISRDFLSTSGASRRAGVRVVSPLNRADTPSGDPSEWLPNLRRLDVACQKGLVERFDATIGAGTVIMPFSGKHRLTPAQVMAAKFPVRTGETETASLMAYGFDPRASEWSPFHGAVYAVVESAAKIVAAGGSHEGIRLTFQEYFERMGDDPYKWQKPFAALLGGFYAQMKLKMPAIGGKDSMSGTYEDKHVPPTLVSFAVQTAKTPDIISPELKKPGHWLVWLKTEYDENKLPVFDTLTRHFSRVTELIRQKQIVAAYVPGVGGCAAALTKMALGSGIGVEVQCDDLYEAETGSFLLELTVEPETALEGMTYTVLGRTVEEPALTVNGTVISLKDCHDTWLSTLEGVFPTGRFDADEDHYIRMNDASSGVRRTPSSVKCAHPRVFLPVFPGSNCEYDTRRVLEKAGAAVNTLVIRNLTVSQLEESVTEMARSIRESQIIMLPGGFSAGDEPEGSGKFIAALFRNPYIAEATLDLLQNRDGLILGICNGFQALIKSGLLPYGDIREIASDDPTLTFNTIGRHVSDLVMTKVVSNTSPWLWNTHIGDTHLIPVSHGEGRFMARREDMVRLIANGQVATQYVDFDGNPSMDIRYNPNGSLYAIEGITSPDGRVLGKMGHSERIGQGLYKGFEMNMDQRIFESGVGYFS